MPISRQLDDTLRRNGIRAQAVPNMDGTYNLAVQTKDSPVVNYTISQQQMYALSSGTNVGMGYENKKAYETFYNIVKQDFDLPKNYSYAKNTGSMVNIGQNGKMVRDYGYGPGMYPMAAGMMYPRYPYPSGRVVTGTIRSDRMDGSLRAGEIPYYEGASYKGPRTEMSNQPSPVQAQAQQGQYVQNRDIEIDPLQSISTIIQPAPERSREFNALAYNEVITSPVYFSKEKFQEVLDSHGLQIDEDKKLLTVYGNVQSEDRYFDLTDQQLQTILSSDIKNVTLQDRVATINDVLKRDFDNGISVDSLNRSEKEKLAFNSAVTKEFEELNRPIVINEPEPIQQEQLEDGYRMVEVSANAEGITSGFSEDHTWTQKGMYGREVDVAAIYVEQEQYTEQRLNRKGQEVSSVDGVKYKMTAVINGESISKEISERDYNRYLAIDDTHRMKMASRVFDEIDLKRTKDTQFSLGAFLAAGGAVLTGITGTAAIVAGDIDRIQHPHGPAPEFYASETRGSRIYVKPGVDDPQSIASRIFDAGYTAGMTGQGNGYHR